MAYRTDMDDYGHWDEFNHPRYEPPLSKEEKRLREERNKRENKESNLEIMLIGGGIIMAIFLGKLIINNKENKTEKITPPPISAPLQPNSSY